MVRHLSLSISIWHDFKKREAYLFLFFLSIPYKVMKALNILIAIVSLFGRLGVVAIMTIVFIAACICGAIRDCR